VADQLIFMRSGQGFLGLGSEFESSRSNRSAVIIPFGLEKSVSYGTGTAKGPEALIAASHEVELFDDEFWCEPVQHFGVATLEPVRPRSNLEPALEQLAAIIKMSLDGNLFPLTLGGEHSLTAGAVRPFAEKYSDLVVVQFDAHADLRNGYQGHHFSHASAMRRVLDHSQLSLVSIGIRSISASEIPFLERNRDRIDVFWARESRCWDVDRLVDSLAGKPVYITFDVDCFDASLMPATGTPEPGGLFFAEVLEILRAIGNQASIVGGDIVELAPIKGMHASDFVAARLAYKLLSYALLEPALYRK